MIIIPSRHFEQHCPGGGGMGLGHVGARQRTALQSMREYNHYNDVTLYLLLSKCYGYEFHYKRC